MLKSAFFMDMALKEAHKALEIDEVPIGAVITCNDQVIAKAYNQTQMLKDVTSHAEIIAITSACEYLGAKYLQDCTIYVTLEPCVMCAGALKWSQIGKLVYGAPDDKYGFMQYGKGILHPKTTVEFGMRMEDSALLLKEFFKKKRMLK